jgi:hypothetical protein
MAEKKKAPRGSEFWQIIFPSVVGAVLLLVLGFWFGLTGSTGSLSRFAQISTVLLALPAYIAILLFGLVMVGLILLVGKLIQVIPTLTGWALELLGKIQKGANLGTSSLARLVIEPTAMLAIFQRKSAKKDQEIKLTD